MKRIKDSYESEELKDIILSRKINNYNTIVIFILVFIALAVILGFLIKYPENIKGKVTVLSNTQTKTIFSPSNGQISLLVTEKSLVEKGDLLSVVVNPGNYEDIQNLKYLLAGFDFNAIESQLNSYRFDKNLKLGEIEKPYHNFLLALIEYESFMKIKVSEQLILNLQKKINRNNRRLNINKYFSEVINEKAKIVEQTYLEDSILFLENAMVSQKFDDSKLVKLSSKEKKIDIQVKNQELKHKNQELFDEIALMEKEKEKKILSNMFNIKKTYFELKTAISFWEYNYVIKSPIKGVVEYYQTFFNTNQYVKKDTPLFIIIPEQDSIYARGIMSSEGYGKIKTMDTVYIKLNDYPFKEYGELHGIVNNKSRVFHDSIYFLDLKLPDGLKTDFGEQLDFSYNMSGEVVYHANKRSIIQRIFSEVQNAID